MAIKTKFDRVAGLLREDDSQSLTADQELRLTTLENNYELIQIWESVTTNTGTVTIPTNAQVEENRWANGIDAICTKIQGVPIDEVAETSTNVPITVTFDTSGNYTLSDIPSSYPVAIIYFISIKTKYVSNISLNQIIDRFDYVSNPFNQELNINNNVEFNSIKIFTIPDDNNSVINKEYADNISRDIIYREAILDILNTHPVSNNTGDRYIVGLIPTDDFVGHSNEIATYDVTWSFEIPIRGWTLLNKATNTQYNYNGTNWIDIGIANADHDSLSNIKGSFEAYHISQTTYNLVSTYTNSNTDISSAISNNHNHTNISILNNIDNTKISNWDSSYTHSIDSNVHVTTILKQSIVDHIADTIIHVTSGNKIDWNKAKSDIDTHVIAINPHNITKTTIGLSNVDNTNDLDKPISTLTQSALDNKSDITHNHSGTYEPVDSTILRTSDIIDTLVSTSTVDALSANQGKTLQDTKVDKVIGKELSTNDLTNELKTSYDNAVTASHGVNDPNSSHYTKEVSDGLYPDFNTEQTISNKTLSNNRVDTPADINDIDENKVACLKNIKESSGGGTVKLLLTDTNFN